MDWIETLQLRSYRKPDRDAAIESFHQLTFAAPENGLGDITLLQDSILDNDLCIIIRWHADIPRTGKSALGLKLAAVFSEFGRIDHRAWGYEGRISRDCIRKMRAQPGSSAARAAQSRDLPTRYA